MLTSLKTSLLEQQYMSIMTYASGHPNDEIYACMLSSGQISTGVMPDDFGLGTAEFNQLLAMHFPLMKKFNIVDSQYSNNIQREDECNDVYRLLVSYRAGISVSEIWMAKIIAIACQGQDHLWQDLGLWSRTQLSELLMCNFPELASKNIYNMKWKKFLYKQLCITEGIYTCRAPSCEVCTDYDHCFGSEE